MAGSSPPFKGRRASRLESVRARTGDARKRAKRPLQDGDRVAIVGAGPAGSFFAIHLLRESNRLNRELDVVIVERHSSAVRHPCGYHTRGCNFCAGGVSPRLDEALADLGLVLPEEIIQAQAKYVWVHGHWKNFRLRVPQGRRMYSVFRGSLPAGRSHEGIGFDEHLLGRAIDAGARVRYGDVRSLSRPDEDGLRLTILSPTGETQELDADFVAVATGINVHCGIERGESPLFDSIKRLNPDFREARSRKTLIFELELGAEYLQRHMDREIHFIEYGSRHLTLEHTALVPKGRYLTVALIGRSVDEAAFPAGGRKVIHEFLALPQIRRMLPGIEAASAACVCFPRMSVSTATAPFGDSFAILGDVVGSRLYKDGMYSAHETARALARSVLEFGIDQKALARSYGKAIRWLARDIRFGRLVFGASRIAFTRPTLSRIFYQSFATEMKVRDQDVRPLGNVLWKIASGTADYGEVLRDMWRPGLIRSVLVGTLVTVRNVAVELLLGLSWGRAGRYPTVVLKEKRAWTRSYLASGWDVELNGQPHFERMYIIKICGTAERIVAELARFGEPGSPFLNVRFLEVRRISGIGNEIGSVVRYRAPFVGLQADLVLSKKKGATGLHYNLEDRFADRGRLVLDVSPTVDGNNKLTVYASFDYKPGTFWAGRIFWRVFRAVFPEFVHDVVWNHALCTIKERIESQAEGGG